MRRMKMRRIIVLVTKISTKLNLETGLLKTLVLAGLDRRLQSLPKRTKSKTDGAPRRKITTMQMSSKQKPMP